MKRLRILIIMFIMSMILTNNCKKGEEKMIYQTETNFNKFITHLKEVCRRKDRAELKKMLYVNFEYFGKENLTFEQQINEFEFKEVLNILTKGEYELYKLSNNKIKGYAPIDKKIGDFKYILRFIIKKNSKGWKLYKIDEGVLVDAGYTEPTQEQVDKINKKVKEERRQRE